MFRRLIAAMLLVMLALTAAAAETVPAAPDMTALRYDSLVDKFIRQLQESGLRGLFSLTVDGEGAAADALRPLSGARLEFRSLTAGHDAELKAQLTRGGETVTNTKLWADGKDLYLRSDLLVDTILRWPWKGDFVSSLSGAGRGNPTLLEPVIRALLHGYDWKTIDNPVRQHLESWMMTFAQSPEQVTVDGAGLFLVRYEIPAQAVRLELKQLLRAALADETMYRQIQFYMTDSQRAVAFSKDNLAYEDRVIDTLPLGDGIRIERLLSARGGTYRETLVFPMPPSAAGWTEVTVVTEGRRQVFTFSGPESELVLDLASVSAQGCSGTLTSRHADRPVLAVAFSVSGTVQERTDDESYLHEVRTWNLEASPTETCEAAAEPVTATLRLHLYSFRDQRSGTTVEIDGQCAIGAAQLHLVGKLASVDQWEIHPMNVDGALDATALSDEKKQELTADFMANLMLMLSLNQPQAAEEPAADETEAATEEAADDTEAADAAGSSEEAPAGADETPGEESTEEAAPEFPEAQTIPYIEEDVDLDEEDAKCNA